MNRLRPALTAVILVFLMMAPALPSPDRPLTIQDSLGRTITLKKPVERMVVLGNYRCEAVKVLGCIHKVVGVDGNSAKGSRNYFPELKKQPLVGTWQTPNVEIIVSLRPDLVITSANAIRVERLEEKLKTFGIPVVGFDFYRDDILVREITTLATLLGAEEAANTYVQWRKGYESILKEYVSTLSEEQKPRIFLEWGPRPGQSYARGSSGDAKCPICGVRNILAENDVETPTVSLEWVARENPDLICKHVSPYPDWGYWDDKEPEKLIQSLSERPAWSAISAIRNKRVGLICPEVVWGPDSIIGLLAFAKWAHPDLDICPEQVYREYCKKFMNLDVPKGLMVVYPPFECGEHPDS
ncbi:ABC transporter substrate-binding protein [Desulfatibacillum aliphaticivorans]|uniref:ABC transporter substrate-binding protein n=1 Tax=Desulfatibacillum aliphaticivorans TaxID=218208 RepID=UPI00040DAB31|nr:ABC transporter substrate-binding protein [Desulfatibacillum aliphaticivorans]